jgi:hypothetical protein
MNPYLEHEFYWQDFHQTFIPTARASLAAQLSPRYFVRVEQYVFIHELDGEGRRPLARPDLFVKDARPATVSTAAVTTVAPAYAYIPATAIDEERHSYLSIRDCEGDEAITIIELLSPSNKNLGADRTDYLKKRREFFAAGLHLVEIDLLRGGPRLPLIDIPTCDYLVAVSRANERPRVGLWPVGIREVLPKIPIPLRGPDPDASLDLQEILNRVYDSARYEPLLYRQSPQPSLNDADRSWAESIVASVSRP